jgi:sec-independent protein translocase protein TatA
MSPTLAILESPVQLLVVAMVALLVFGNRLPEVMRSLGKGMSEFKKGMRGLEDQFTQATYSSSYYEPAHALPVEVRSESNGAKLMPPAQNVVETQAVPVEAVTPA